MGQNLIDNSFNSLGQPWVTSQDVDFMQYGIRDASAGIIESLLGANYDATKSYILKGCVLTSTAGTTTISPGYIFGISRALGSMVARTYLYSCAGMSFADPVGPNVVVGNVVAFPQSYDPVTFADSSTHSIHNEWRVVFSAGASGSGDVNYSDLLFYNVAWTNVTSFGTQWAAAANAARCRRDNFNVVRLESGAKTTGTTPSGLIMTLDVGFRPSGTISPVAVLFDFGTVTYSPVVIKILSNGQVVFENTADIPVTANCVVLFSGITFTTD